MKQDEVRSTNNVGMYRSKVTVLLLSHLPI